MNELKKKCIVAMLPSREKEANCVIGMFGDTHKLLYRNTKDIPRGVGQHLYFALADEIDDLDLIPETEHLLFVASFNSLRVVTNSKLRLKTPGSYHKIIATTDSSLYIQGDKMEIKQPKDFSQYYSKLLSTVSDAFIRAYIKAYNERNPITEVMIEYEFICTNEDFSKKPVQLSGYYQPKLRSNEIIITKVKDNWNRESIKNLINLYATTYAGGSIDRWLDENLD